LLHCPGPSGWRRDAGAVTSARVSKMKIGFFFLKNGIPKENLMTHLKSEHFRVIRGAMNLLKEPYEMMFHTAFTRKEWRKFNG
jgi:hypothetical protein